MSQAVQSTATTHPKRCPKCGDAYRGDALFCPVCGSALVLAHDAEDAHGNGSVDPYLGTEILGHIEIQKLAGIGAMGRVYRAHQRGVDRDVAVKILRREISGNEQLAARFTREAKVASRLSHPHVVQVYLAGQLPDGSMYIVMEFLDGLSLHSVLAASAGEPLSLERTLHIAVQLCDAVGEAHNHDVVHRDLKPENVMLIQRAGDANFVKVLDFGIARLRASDQSMSTAAGLIFGTARYISPEGAQGMGVTPASDVYSLATVFYQLLTGHTPFEHEQPVQLLLQHIHEQPPPLHVYVGDSIPPPIADVIMKNLSKDPSKRDADGHAFGRALVDAALECGIVPEVAPRDSWSSRSSGIQLPRRDSKTPGGAGGGGSSDAGTRPPDSVEAASPEKRGARTTKWTPSTELSLRLSPTPRPAEAALLDVTIDDDDLQNSPQRLPRTSPTVPDRRTELQELRRGASHQHVEEDEGVSKKGGRSYALALFGACVIALAAVFTALVYFRPVAPQTNAVPTVGVSTAGDPKRPDSPSGVPPETPLPVLSPVASPERTVLAPWPTGTASAQRVRIVLGKTPQAPAVGQSVQFTATVVGGDPKTLSDAHFLVQGPGVNTKLPAAFESGSYRAALTFFEAGGFTVIFRSTADSREVTGSMGIAVGGSGGGVQPPKVPSLLPPPMPSPPGTVKWL